MLLIVPWIIWWKTVDRNRLMEILTFGLLLSTIVVLLDTTGIHNQWWIYNSKLVQIIPHLIPMDYSVLPVGYMLTYQFFGSWRRYILAAIVLSAIGAFIIEPFFVYLDIYEQLKWRHFYSFVIYILIAIVIKFTIEQINHLNHGDS
ncbi:CBO0543 family protein [Alkalihalobacillus sp. TS-13]|uniref:CBO0543 family protein n=1 Tax=Alkalihalobacillus sp. TS-13 TaxID=2842455 RepID=UPI001C86F88C|nr:CBO0543 family protein [Alkalihalobacillus sp. TS-13]